MPPSPTAAATRFTDHLPVSTSTSRPATTAASSGWFSHPEQPSGQSVATTTTNNTSATPGSERRAIEPGVPVSGLERSPPALTTAHSSGFAVGCQVGRRKRPAGTVSA